MSFATRETPIYSIPFPAVTICPESKTYQRLYNHTRILRKHIEKKPLTPQEYVFQILFLHIFTDLKMIRIIDCMDINVLLRSTIKKFLLIPLDAVKVTSNLLETSMILDMNNKT